MRRVLTTPRQKRQATKERYQTYTIPQLGAAAQPDCGDVDDEDEDDATYVHRDNDHDDDDADAGVDEKLDANKPIAPADDVHQTVHIEIGEPVAAQTTTATRLTTRQRRQEDRVRFQTQVNHS